MRRALIAALAALWCAPALAETRIHNVGKGFTNVYAVESDEGVILIDTHNPGMEKTILRKLEKAGIAEDRVTAILLTHPHPDHAGSSAALAAHLDVPVLIGAGDVGGLTRGDPEVFRVTGLRGSLITLVVHMEFPLVDPEAVEVIPVDGSADLSAWGISGEATEVGHHSPGSLVVRLDSGEVFLGDLVRSHMLRRRVPALHFFMIDLVGAHDAVRGEVAEGGEVFLPGHGGPLMGARLERYLEGRARRHEARFEDRYGPPSSDAGGEPDYEAG